MGVKHTEPCRDRIESRLRAEGDESMTRADARVNEHLADRVQEAESGPSGAQAGARENLAAAPPEGGAAPDGVGVGSGPGAVPTETLPSGGEAEPDPSDDPEGSEPMSLEEGHESVAEELNYLTELLGQPDSLTEGGAGEAQDLVRVLFYLGVSPGDVRSLITEVFSPPRVTAAATRFPHYGALPGGAYDLRPGPGGRAWDFDKPEDREEASRRIDREQPYLLVGSPPRTDWCALNARLNHPKMDPAIVAERRRRARAHLGFVVKLYLGQLARGRTSSTSTRQRRTRGRRRS